MRHSLFLLLTLSISSIAGAQESKPSNTLPQSEIPTVFLEATSVSEKNTLSKQEIDETSGGTIECELIDDGSGFPFWYPWDCPR